MSQNPPQNDYRALLQQALVSLEQMEAKLLAAEAARHEPIAIIGMGFRFPGGANDASSFWELLLNGTDAITEVPPERWNAEQFYNPDPDAIGKSYSRWGGFLKNVDQFDPYFFGISPREAISMDPQQRLLLETTWEALENAGQASSKLAGSRTGVFVGMVGSDYANLKMISGSVHEVDAYFGTGIARSIAAGRIAYTFGLHGPAVSVDTACSSSLVAAHQACQSLRNRECDMAIVGGVNLILEPSGYMITSRGRMASFDGRCKTFDATADGYVRAEGCAMIVIKRLSDAVADGDNILAAIMGTALNQDGRSNGLTAPNGKAQEAVIRAALQDAHLKPADISYVETHGTGTSLGDPIEVRALGAVFAEGHNPQNPLMIGSVKTNVGHLEAAAGIIGLVKVVLALQNKTIPPHIHLNEPNPYIPWKELPVTVPTKSTEWLIPDGKQRIAGLSSFGFSGTNSHMIIADAPIQQIRKSNFERTAQLFTLSAKTESALKELAERYESYFQEHPTTLLSDVTNSLNTGRSHFGYRLALIANSVTQTQEKLSAWLQDSKSASIHTDSMTENRKPEVVFLFTGQGSQSVGMARQLYETQPIFRKTLEQCDQLLRPLLDKPLLSVVYPENNEVENLIHQTEYTQPALFAIEYSLAKLWQSWGVEPVVVMGHSVGEYVAACLAGVFGLEDGLKLIAARGRLMQSLPAGGVMVSVFADEGQVREAIAPYAKEVSIAAVNGPEAVVISGVESSVGLVIDSLQKDRIKSQPLNVSHAFHSPLMDSILDQFEQVAKSVQYHSPQIGVISNVYGKLIVDDSISNATYWREHIRQTVRFADGIHALHAEGYRSFLEIGPSATLLAMARRCDSVKPNDVWLASLRPGRGEWEQMLDSLAQLYVNGADVDWEAFERDYKGQRQKLDLPTYPFQRERYWLNFEPKNSTPEDRTDHPLLGAGLTTAVPVFQKHLNASNPSYLSDHRIHEAILLPAAAYVEIALAAAKHGLRDANYVLENISIHEALTLSPDVDRVTQLVLTPDSAGASFQYFSRESTAGEDSWCLHAKGNIRFQEAGDSFQTISFDELRARTPQPMSVEAYYGHLLTVGAAYGLAFRGIEEIWRTDGEALGRIKLPVSLTDDTGKYSIHPALLDACFQLLGTAVPGIDNLDSEENSIIYVPIGIQRIHISGEVGTTVYCHVRLQTTEPPNSKTLSGDLQIFSESGNVLAVVNGLRLQQISREALERATHIDVDQWFYQMDWVEQPLTSTQPKKNDVGNWLIFANESAVSTHLVEQLKSKGENCYLVLEGNQFEHNDSMQWRINPTAPDQFHQLLNEVTAEAKETLYGVIDLWGIQRSLSDQSDLESIHSSLERANGSLLYLVQALASSKNRMPRLWLVTQGAQAIKNESSVNPLATTLWGFGNVIALEHPALNCARIDLDLSDTDPGNLFDEIWDSTDEDQVAFRNNKRYVARLVHGAGLSKPTESSNIESVNVRADATYLISGGLGGLGFVSAHWLVDKGARHLVLLGRSDPSTDVQRVINEMKSQGVDIYVAPVDVSQKEQLEKLFHHIEGNMPPLCGVIHAAGVVDDGILNEQTWSRFRTVMAPKIDGTWNLHTLTSGLNLDFFILFSAGAALLGSAGQGNYASANAFLDGFAQYRHQCGLPVLSINWGAWADVGMASRLGSQNRRRWTSRGMNLIQPARGIQAMQRLMERHVNQVAVLPIDWNQFGGQQNGKSIQPLLRQMIQGKAAQPQTSTLTLAEIENISASEQEHALQEYIKGQVTQVLGLDPSQSLNMYLPLINLGMDSLMAVELKNKIENDFGINVPIAYFLEEASVNGLAAKLHDTLSHNALEKQKDNNNNETIDGAKAQLLLENIDQMSEDEMDALLNKLLTDKEES